MKKVQTQTLKGFRDFLPNQAKKRQWLINTLISVFESYGFEPLETPALEYEEILLGKYGQEGDKLMYRFEDNGKRKVALRYDQTVPLARVVAQYQNDLSIPFKRYQIQNVWRAENTQRGRYREFLQVDADIVGSSSALSDAEIIEVAAKSLEKLGFGKFKILINDISVFAGISKQAVVIIDKLKKIGEEGVLNELIKKGLAKDKNESVLIFRKIKEKSSTENLKRILSSLEQLGVMSSKIKFSPTLSRGLDYYTGMIFEVEIEGYGAGSVAGGGRYDDLIGTFAGKKIPAVGFAFGFDRLMEAMEQFNLFPKDLNKTQALVTIFSKELKEKSLEVYKKLRDENINAELYLDENAPFPKQLKYADKKGILYVLIIGPKEAKENKVTIKNLKTGEQKTVSKNEAAAEIKLLPL